MPTQVINEPSTSSLITITEVKNVFKDFFFKPPVFITELPSREVIVKVIDKQNIEIDPEESKRSSGVTFQGKVNFYPFLLQTAKDTLIVIGSDFSLYNHITREPYQEAKAEFQFQNELKSAMKLKGGYAYYLPGSSEDFFTKNTELQDVHAQDLSLRYEHDNEFFYLFILV